MIKIAIDNGHGLYTAGKRTPAFPNTGKVIKEWEFNHPTAKKLETILNRHGIQTLMVSDTENDTPLADRVNKANKWGADAFISIHYNAFQSIWGPHGGIETFAHKNSTKGNQLAKNVQDNLIQITGLRNRGVKHNSLYVTNKTNMPSILVECGFMDNLQEASLMLNDTHQNNCATAIAKGIMSTFGIKYVPQQSNPGKPSNPSIPSKPSKPDTHCQQVDLKDWQKKQGELALNNIANKTNNNNQPIVNDIDKWKNELGNNIPGWLFWHIIDKITD